MSAVPKIIEGTLDEVLEHSAELVGHRLRVTILDDDKEWLKHSAFDTSAAGVEAWVANFRNHLANLPVGGILDDSRDSIYDEQLDHQL